MSTTRPVPAPRRDQLTARWRLVVGAGWALIFCGFLAVLVTSQRLGLNTWWLGPFGDPASPVVTVAPFVAPALMVMLAANNVRFLPVAGLVAAAVTAVVGALDLGQVRRLAAVELALAASGALLSVASLGGYLRPAPERTVSVPAE